MKRALVVGRGPQRSADLNDATIDASTMARAVALGVAAVRSVGAVGLVHQCALGKARAHALGGTRATRRRIGNGAVAALEACVRMGRRQQGRVSEWCAFG